MQITLSTNGKTNTQLVMKPSISLVLAAVLLTAVLALPAAAQLQVPFKGSCKDSRPTRPSHSVTNDAQTSVLIVLLPILLACNRRCGGVNRKLKWLVQGGNYRTMTPPCLDS